MALLTGAVAQLFRTGGSPLTGTAAPPHRYIQNAPIQAIHFIDIILEQLKDRFYLIIKIGDVFFRHFRSSDTAIRMHTDWDNDIERLYQYIRDNFYDYGRIELSSESTLLWVKEQNIVNELYPPESTTHMLQSINGVIAAINGREPQASREELYHFTKLRFETDPRYRDFINHPSFEQYITNKITSLIKNRKK